MLFFEKYVQKIPVLLKSDTNNEYCTLGQILIFHHISLKI